MLTQASDHLFKKIARRASEVFIYQLDSQASDAVHEACADFIMHSFQSMTPIFRMGMRAAVWYLNISTVVRFGLLFMNCPREQCDIVLKRWSESVFGPKRDVVRFFLNFTVIAFYDMPEVLKKEGVDLDMYTRMQKMYNGVPKEIGI